MQYLAILGRQPKISLAELESLFSNVKYLGGNLATFESKKEPEISRLGGTIKLAREISFLENNSGKSTPVDFLLDFVKTNNYSGKLVIGVSDYSKNASARGAQGEALHVKRLLKNHEVSARVLPNKSAGLSSATVFHNQLGEKPGRFELIKVGKKWYVGIGVQNINAYTKRDQARPARDAKNGMLPPKLAQILVNLCGSLRPGATVLDPFCGTGVVLQEAILMGYRAYGTDKSERIVGFAKKNLDWLMRSNLAIGKGLSNSGTEAAQSPFEGPKTWLSGPERPEKGALRASAKPIELACADATDFTWRQPIDAVAFEGYLGPPMSNPPADIKLKSVMADIYPLYYHTLRNLSSQIKSGTPVVMAVPAWLRPDGRYQRLNLLDEIDNLGYNVIKYQNLSQNDLLYFRDGQVVAREIIVLRKK